MRRARFSYIVGVIGVVCVMLGGITAVLAANSTPAPGSTWLSLGGGGSEVESNEYYAAINAPATLDSWLTQYGFPTEVVSATYFSNDAGLGRLTRCRENGGNLVCYITYYGLAPGGPASPALADTVNQANVLFSTGIVYSSSVANGGANQMQFYVYDENDDLSPTVTFDSEGAKFVPQACLACHGGSYNSTSNSVSGPSFIPINPHGFTFSPQQGYTLADQQESFRMMNSWISDTTNLSTAWRDMLEGMYPQAGGVGQIGNTAVSTYTPSAWQLSAELDLAYDEVVAENCRVCHASLSGTRDFLQPTDLNNARRRVYDTYIMPHSEQSFNAFWQTTDGAVLAIGMADTWTNPTTFIVTRFDDPTPDGCVSGDCSLREAIIAANGSSGTRNPIVTFADITGTYTLTQTGSGEDAALTGDLDLTNSSRTILLLGRGGKSTVIDGNGLDRVFHVHAAATVRMQHVTVQNGVVSGDGGGIYNEGTLVLTDSNIKGSEASASGGGVANLGELTVDRVRMSGNTAVSGGGLATTGNGQSSVWHSTVDGNSGTTVGGGVYVRDVTASATLSHTTLYNNSSISGTQINLNGGALSLGYSVVAHPTALSLCAGTVASLGYNLFQVACSVTGNTTGNVAGVDPELTMLESGTHTDGYAFAASSPLRDGIPQAVCDVGGLDALQTVRPVDSNGDGSYNCDIGAYEMITAVVPTLTISASGSSSSLAWQAVDYNCFYGLYRSTSPYSDFALWVSDPATNPYGDAGTVGSVGVNYFYYMQAGACGAEGEKTAVSGTVGAFDFGLVVGE